MEKENDFQTGESVMSELYRETYLNSYRIIVTGSCKFIDYDFMSRELDKLFWLSPEFCDNDIKIISGMADGADTLAIRYADEHKLTKILFPANCFRNFIFMASSMLLSLNILIIIPNLKRMNALYGTDS